MSVNKNIWLITADMGYKMWDKVRDDYPERFVNVGAAEQLMMGTAVGLALEEQVPIVYSITPFLIYRPFEWIRNYLNHEKIPVKMVGSGRNKDYEHDGFTHDASDDAILGCFTNIVRYTPETIEEMLNFSSDMLTNNKPTYINLRR